MIESPKNFIEQFQNFIEHIAGVMNGLVSAKKAQTFTTAEKKQARDNIEAVSLNDLSNQFNNKIDKAGLRGQLAGYETASQSVTTVNQDSPDAGYVSTSVTLSNGEDNTSWIKCYNIQTATLNVSLGSSWKWSGNETPEIAQYDFLVCAWIGDAGFASVAKRSA